MLRALTFDFWGTLYQYMSARDRRLHLLEEALARHAQPRPWEALEVAYEHTMEVWTRVWQEERRSLGVDHWLHQMLDSLDAALPKDVLAGLHNPVEEIYLHGDRPRPIVGVVEVLPRLSQRYRLGLISDVGLTPGRVLRELMRRDELLPLFRVLTFSDETRATKPCPEQFLHTLDALGVRPEEAAHIGDLPETDIVGARGVGMKAILFLGESRREDGLSLADAAFERYGELESLLASLG